MTFDVAEGADFEHERAHRLVIGRFKHYHSVIRAHRPEFLHDFHAHFLRLSYGGVAAFHCVLDIANPLICKLNQPDISSHDLLLLSCYCTGKTIANSRPRKKTEE